jgi:hypothetical protein
VHYAKLQVNLSTYLSADLQQDYSALNPENEGMTIEHYFIAKRKSKNCVYNELTLSEIVSVTLQYGVAFE